MKGEARRKLASRYDADGNEKAVDDPSIEELSEIERKFTARVS